MVGDPPPVLLWVTDCRCRIRQKALSGCCENNGVLHTSCCAVLCCAVLCCAMLWCLGDAPAVLKGGLGEDVIHHQAQGVAMRQRRRERLLLYLQQHRLERLEVRGKLGTRLHQQ